ncbi:MAG: hypothetical protein AABY06_00015 [Nanoarchaeota archaeon]
MKTIKNLLLTGIGVASLALGGCSDKTQIIQVGDLTGDSIQDVLMYEDDPIAYKNGNILFVGQKNGKFVKAREVVNNPLFSPSISLYFETEDGNKYFFDGKFYRLSPKQK